MYAFRPLNVIGRALSLWARDDYVQTTVEHSGRVRAAVDSIGIALGWMSKGYQYDDRSFARRMRAGNWFWRQAYRQLFSRGIDA